MEIIKRAIAEETRAGESSRSGIMQAIIAILVASGVVAFFIYLGWTWATIVGLFFLFIAVGVLKSRIHEQSVHRCNIERLREYEVTSRNNLERVRARRRGYYLYLHTFHVDDVFMLREPYVGPPVTTIVEVAGRPKTVTTTPEIEITIESPIKGILGLAKKNDHEVVCLANLSDPLKDDPDVAFLVADDDWKSLFAELCEGALRIFFYISNSHKSLSENIAFELQRVHDNPELREKAVVVTENAEAPESLNKYPKLSIIVFRENLGLS